MIIGSLVNEDHPYFLTDKDTTPVFSHVSRTRTLSYQVGKCLTEYESLLTHQTQKKHGMDGGSQSMFVKGKCFDQEWHLFSLFRLVEIIHILGMAMLKNRGKWGNKSKCNDVRNA